MKHSFELLEKGLMDMEERLANKNEKADDILSVPAIMELYRIGLFNYISHVLGEGEPMKHCIDCIHCHQETSAEWDIPTGVFSCKARPYTCRVTGKEKLYTCDIERHDPAGCGKEAKYFEPRGES